MINVEALVQSLMVSSGKAYRPTGWITPTGDFIQVDPYGHFAGLDDSRYDDLIEAIQIATEKEHEDQRAFIDSHESGDHIGWHAYDSEWDSVRDFLRDFILTTIYRDGYVRYYRDNIRQKLNVETSPERFKALKSDLKAVADLIRLKLEYDPQPYTSLRDRLEIDARNNEFQLSQLDVREKVFESFLRADS